jgi:hypothetical protein
MGAKEILGAPGHNKVCAGGAVGKFSVLPREVSYGPTRRSWVAGRISREVKSPVMPCEKSEWPAVLMNQGTKETLGPTLCAVAGGDSKGTDLGKGSRWEW